jgi:hypothetical protein
MIVKLGKSKTFRPAWATKISALRERERLKNLENSARCQKFMPVILATLGG